MESMFWLIIHVLYFEISPNFECCLVHDIFLLSTNKSESQFIVIPSSEITTLLSLYLHPPKSAAALFTYAGIPDHSMNLNRGCELKIE